MHVRTSEITVATLLKQHGYATAHSGKWHLNGRFNLADQPQPNHHGFDYWFSTQNNALPNHHDPDNFVRNGQEVGKLEGYAADIVAKEAIDWLAEKRDKQKPFFLYVCFHEPHEPIASAPKYAEKYARFNDPARAAHHGNITQMDAAFGRLMAALDEENLRDNTIVIFTSDNGPAITPTHPYGSAGPLRSKKGFLYEGGIRVPGMIRWPGQIEAGSESDEPVSGVDLLPTLCALTRMELPNDRKIDGSDICPLFEGESIKRATPLYWQFHHAANGPQVAMREGDWKILAYTYGENPGPGSSITAEAMEHINSANLKSFELYNLKADIGETTNLAEREPARLEAMKARLTKLYREIQQENPTWPVWKATNYDGQRIKYETDARKQKRTGERM
jgi:arylsulfatase A